MAAKVAIVTLTASLSHTVGRYKFEKNKPVRVTDPALIEALKTDGAFAVQEVKEEAGDKAPNGKGKVLKEPAQVKDSPVKDAGDKGPEAGKK